MTLQKRKTFWISALGSAVGALALVVSGYGFVATAEAATSLKNPPPPQSKTLEKPTLSSVKEQAKEKIKEDAKQKAAEKLGIEKKEPMLQKHQTTPPPTIRK